MPLLYETGTTKLYQLQDWQDALEFNANVTVDFACPGTSILLKGRDTGLILIEATCRPHSVEETDLKWSDVTCKGPIEPIKQHEAVSCGDDARNMSVFFKLAPDRFAHVFSICAISERGITYYTYHEMAPLIKLRDINLKRQEHLFMADIGQFSMFHGVEVLKLFNREFQRTTVNRQARVYLDDDTYVKNDGLHYFIMNYLIPAQDFYYEAYQNATFLFTNTVPQWKSVSKNWANVEDDVRYFSMGFMLSLKIWTGVLGQAEVAKTYSIWGQTPKLKFTKIYMYLATRAENHIFPVPGVFWKLVYHEPTTSAIVFVTLNNPDAPEELLEQTLCKDVSNGTGWMVWDKYNTTFGYSYACTYDDFVTYLPVEIRIPVTKLLTWIP